jgi:hypothetical protein
VNSRRVNIITGFFGLAVMMTFVIGLAHSIATGFAGLKGGMPIIIIVAFVVSLAMYDFYDQCFRQRRK